MRSLSNKLASAVIAVAALLGIDQRPAAAQQVFEMKLAAVGVNDPNIAYLEEFKKRVETRSNGRITAKVFPGSQLGSVSGTIENLQLGTVEMFSIPPGFLKGVHTAFQVTEAPGLFASYEHAHKVMTDPAFLEPFLALGQNKGVKGVSIWIYGPQSYATRTPFRKLSDLRGLKLAVRATKVETEAMARLGASGIPMDVAETLPAIQNRTLDGQRSSIVMLSGRQYWNVTKYITIVSDGWVPCVEFVSTKFLERLPADLRQLVSAVGHEMNDWGTETAKAFDAQAAANWDSKGGEVIRLSRADESELLQKLVPIGDEYLGQSEDKDTRSLYETLKSLAKKYQQS